MCHGKKAEKLAKFRVLDKAPEGSIFNGIALQHSAG